MNAPSPCGTLRRTTGFTEQPRERPPARAPDAGVSVALRCLARDFLVRHRVECGVHLSEEPMWFPADRAAVLLRIVEEALANIACHAAASRVDIVLRHANGRFELKVRDNGNGFDPSARAENSGLPTMRDLAGSLGGDLELASSPGRGTVVRLVFALS